MRTINQVSLQGLWKTYYSHCKKHHIGSIEDDQRADLYNKLLKDELTNLQKNGKRISQDEVYRLCADITRRIYDLRVDNLEEVNLKALRGALDAVSIVGAMSCVDSSGVSYDYAHMHYMAHIPLAGLSESEIAFLIDLFGGDIDESWNVLIFMALKIKINSYEYIRNNSDKIERMCKNAIYDKFNSEVNNKYNVDLGYATRLIDKLRDFFTLRLM